jgi:hypothetical protein
MESKNKNIDKYFESARKFKSPVSIDKARNLIEMKDLNKMDKLSFFSKKGVKIMAFSSLIISSLLIYSLSTGLFFNDKPSSENKIATKEISNVETNQKIRNQNPKEITNDYSEKEINDLVTTISDKGELKPNKSTDRIKGMNSIVLSDDELSKFNIKLESTESEGKTYYGIGFWNKISPKNAVYMTFTLGAGSTHKFVELPSEEEVKFVTLQPNVFTDFKGSIFFQTTGALENSNDLNEFIKFKDNFIEFYKMQFNQETFPTKIPANIDADLKELNKLLIEFQAAKNNASELGKKINSKFVNLNQYFSKIAVIEQEPSKIEIDTNIVSYITLYIEGEPTADDLAYQESMKKNGVKVTLSKRKMTIRDFLNTEYKNLETELNTVKKQIEKYILVNKMIAVEIPIKNSPDNQGFILWFSPSQELIDLLPARYRTSLAKEFKLLENEDAVCGAKIENEKCYLDIWRACSGAIENLRVFPNPVKSNLNIKFELKENRNINFAIHDINGDKIKDLSNIQTTGIGTNSFLFDISELRAGLYLIVVSSDNGEQAVQRIIKE